jgi:hypothetical protein
MFDNVGWILGVKRIRIYTDMNCDFKLFERMRFSSAWNVECGRARWTWNESKKRKRSKLKSGMRMLNVNEGIVWLLHVVHADDCSKWAVALYRV